MEPIIECKNLNLGYEKQTVLADVNCIIYPGDYIAVVGENGSGKSTFIKGLLGFIKPLSGEIRTGILKNRHAIGYLPQQSEVQKDFPATVYEVVISGCLKTQGLRPFYNSKEKQLVSDNLKKLGIEQLKNKSYRELSGGQKQRVKIARALCAAEGLFILDEPVTGLDPEAVAELYKLIERLNKEDKMTIIMVTHDMQNALKYANKVLHLEHKMIYFGDSKKYIQDGNFFGGEA